MASWARAARRRNPGPKEDAIVEDPRGFEILIRADRWKRHVLKRHHGLEPFHRAVAQAIGTPDFITQSATHAGRNLYYRWLSNAPDADLPFVVAVVQMDYERSAGDLRTAYFEAEKPEGERIIWTP